MDLDKTTIEGVIVWYRTISVMGYYNEQNYGKGGGLVSARGDLTIDVGSGRNEASTIVSGGVLDVHGEWENRSNYLLFSPTWVGWMKE